MAKMFVLQNAQPENLGIIGQIFTQYGLQAEYIRTFEGEPVPRYMDDAAGLVVLGGPMSVYENNRYPFLNDAMRLVDQALKREKPILGICLGSQLLAAALGANVYANGEKEIGWHDVTLHNAGADALCAGMRSPFVGFHWHGDVFDLPDGARSLGSSDLTAHQFFCYGDRSYGALFHMEVTEQIIADMTEVFADEVRQLGLDGAAIQTESQRHLKALHDNARIFYQQWAALCLQA